MNKIIDWLEFIWTTDLPSNSKFVAAYLRTYMNAKRDLCWPSVGRIAKETGLSEQTVRTHLKTLEQAGFLQIERSNGGRPSGTNRYKAILPNDANAAIKQIDDANTSKAPLQPLDPTPATVAPLPLQPLDPNIQGNKQGNKQILNNDDCPVELAERAIDYWMKKGATIDLDEQWQLFCAHHQSKPNARIKNYGAAWRTWYVNAVKFNQSREKKDPAMTRLRDTSWADSIINKS